MIEKYKKLDEDELRRNPMYAPPTNFAGLFSSEQTTAKNDNSACSFVQNNNEMPFRVPSATPSVSRTKLHANSNVDDSSGENRVENIDELTDENSGGSGGAAATPSASVNGISLAGDRKRRKSDVSGLREREVYEFTF